MAIRKNSIARAWNLASSKLFCLHPQRKAGQRREVLTINNEGSGKGDQDRDDRLEKWIFQSKVEEAGFPNLWFTANFFNIWWLFKPWLKTHSGCIHFHPSADPIPNKRDLVRTDNRLEAGRYLLVNTLNRNSSSETSWTASSLRLIKHRGIQDSVPKETLFAYQRKGNQLIVLLLIPLPLRAQMKFIYLF